MISLFQRTPPRLLAAVVVLLAAPPLCAQNVTDSVPVTLTIRTKLTFNGGCQTYVNIIGTHPDPKGNGRDADYSYYGTFRGKDYRGYYDPFVELDLAPDDSPGKFITYTAGLSYTLSPFGCDYDLITRSAAGMAQSQQYARYTMPAGVHAFYTYSSNGLQVCFDASNSFVLSKTGRRPVTRYSWDFGDGSTDTSGETAVQRPCHRYSTPDIYYPKLTVYDDQGNSDTYDDIVVLTEGVLAAEERIELKKAGKRAASAGMQSETTLGQGDTLTVVGIIKNTGMAEVRSVEAYPAFYFQFDIPDSLYQAILRFPVLKQVEDVGPPTMRTSLAPGETIEVRQQFVVEQTGQYQMNSSDPYQDAPFHIKPFFVRAQGVNTAGDTIRAIDRCAGATPGQGTLCEEDYTTVAPKVTVGVEEQSEMQGTFALHLPNPNPFNATTAFTLDMPDVGTAIVEVYDAKGTRVAVLLDERVVAGRYPVRFDAGDLPSGVYMVRAVSPYGTQSRTVVLER